MYATTAAHSTAVGTAYILANGFMPEWGYPRQCLTMVGNFFPSFMCGLQTGGDSMKLITSVYIPMVNDGTERVKHTMAQLLSTVVNGRENDWDE